MVLDIVKLGEESLRQKSEPVPEVNDEIRQLAQDMFETMIEKEGVGLAAPQIGRNIRMFVLIADDEVRRVFINPQIIKTSSEMSDYDEGCLSIPQVYETITRPAAVTVQALNENGRPFTLDADGFLYRHVATYRGRRGARQALRIGTRDLPPGDGADCQDGRRRAG